MKLALTTAEIVVRKPVWWALSELFLDTELPSNWLMQIAEMVRSSGYSEEEIHRIFRREVSPVFCLNHLAVAGEWESWSEDEVEARVTAFLSCSQLSRWAGYGFSLLAKPENIWRRFLPYLEGSPRNDGEVPATVISSL